MALNLSQPHGLVRGHPTAVYSQGGRYYDSDGNLVPIEQIRAPEPGPASSLSASVPSPAPEPAPAPGAAPSRPLSKSQRKRQRAQRKPDAPAELELSGGAL